MPGSTSAKAIRDVPRAATDQGKAAGLDIARPVDDVDCLCDLHSARHPQERCATAAASIPGPRRW
jgi:hypothetical protein